MLGQLDQPVDTELRAVGVARLDDAVAVQEQPIARFQELLGGLGGVRGERRNRPKGIRWGPSRVARPVRCVAAPGPDVPRRGSAAAP